MRHEVRFSGFGGQGIILSAVILGRAAVMHDNKLAVQTQVYVPLQTAILLAPLGVLALLLFGTTIALLLTPLGMLYQDVGRALGFGTQALFVLTPIIYPVPQTSWAVLLVILNPVTPLHETTRDWLVLGQTSHVAAFVWVSGVSLLLLFAGWVLYRIAMPHLISRMSA